MRVGGSTKIDADVRLIFATLRPLEQEVHAGRFRADLFYRIQGITVNVPPLRERGADILPLTSQFVSQLSKKHKVQAPRFTRDAKAALVGYSWPGNVRELRNVVETLCLLREGRTVRRSDLPSCVRAEVSASLPRVRTVASSVIALELNDGLEAMIRQIIESALVLDDGKTREVARRLKISPRTVQRYVASGRARTPARSEG
jgi:DNA-binding NtrC family response regulator